MRILVCVSEYPPDASGIGNVAYRMVKEFEMRGHTCTVCSPTGPDITLGSHKMIRRLAGLGVLYYWWRVSQYFARRSPPQWDAVWLHWPMFLRQSPFPSAVVTFHGTYRGFRDMANDMPSSFFLRSYYALMQSAETRYLRRLNGSGYVFTAVSPRTAEELRAQGVSADNVLYIPVGVDTERFHPMPNRRELKAEIGIPADATVFLYIGRLTYPKNLFRLVDTFAEVKGRLKEVVLLMAGSGELAEPLTRYIREKKVSDIKLLGFIPNEELPRFCASADFLIMASKYEGQPVALLEGMAAGLPPIVSQIPVMKQVVEESGVGIVVDFGVPGQAAAQIVDYVFSAKAQQDGKGAREYVASNMSSALCAERYLELLQSIA